MFSKQSEALNIYMFYLSELRSTKKTPTHNRLEPICKRKEAVCWGFGFIY